MADTRRRRRLTTLLLGAAAPALVVGGLFLAGGGLEATAPVPAPAVQAAPPPAIRVAGPTGAPASAPSGPSVPSPAPAAAAGVRPQVVVVPALGVEAPVTPIRTVDGVLTPPSDPQQVGWWADGARPGAARGAAVVTGHTVHTGGGAFDDLETLTPGDRVTVGSGADTLTYRVGTVEVLSRDELARRSADVFGRTGPGRLVLITCEDWDGTGYRSNVVVTAQPVG
ncbi:class F sortase [Nocardioides sp. T5]|uniref:class F sortase n=1 Tax=Nocardioides sp. T5 TaxID=3400182 RepID=UPI003A855B2C